MYCVFAIEGDGADFYGRVVPFVNIDPLVIHICASIIFLIIFFSLCVISNKKMRVDGVCVQLVIKGILDLVPFAEGITVEFSMYFQYYICSWIALVIYFMLINSDFGTKDIEKIKRLFIWFGIVLTIQIIYTAVNCGVGYFDPTYKIHLVIPYGGSNIIAAILAPIACLAWSTYRKCLSGKLILSFLVLGLLLIKSRGTILVLFVWGLHTYYRIGLKSRKNKALIIGVGILLIVLCVFFLLSEYVADLYSYSIIGADESLIDLILNGRLQLWTEYFVESVKMQHLIFGAGMYPQEIHGAGLHNLILDLFVRCGIVGFVNYCTMYWKLYRKGKRVSDSTFLMMATIITLNSMYEICYFNYKCDVMLWIIIGVTMNEYYVSKRKYILD